MRRHGQRERHQSCRSRRRCRWSLAVLSDSRAKTITATATAGARGGVGKSARCHAHCRHDGFDERRSDPGCSVSGATELTCAEAGARTLLQAFNPSIVSVGLMVFPGVTSTTPPGMIMIARAATRRQSPHTRLPSPLYQIVGFSTDYKTSPAATTLNASSNLVRLLGAGAAAVAGLQAVGGYGTYYAGVIAAAQAALDRRRTRTRST